MQYCFKFSNKTDCLCLFFLSRLNSSLSTKRLVDLSLPSRYSFQELRYCYHGSQKTRTCCQQILQHLRTILLIDRQYIKNNKGSRIEPSGTPALTSDWSEACPFNKTLCILFFRKSHKRFNKLPDISFCLNLKTKPSCQTLSNTFNISGKILTSNPLSNDLYIS